MSLNKIICFFICLFSTFSMFENVRAELKEVQFEHYIYILDTEDKIATFDGLKDSCRLYLIANKIRYPLYIPARIVYGSDEYEVKYVSFDEVKRLVKEGIVENVELPYTLISNEEHRNMLYFLIDNKIGVPMESEIIERLRKILVRVNIDLHKAGCDSFPRPKISKRIKNPNT